MHFTRSRVVARARAATTPTDGADVDQAVERREFPGEPPVIEALQPAPHSVYPEP